MASVYQKMLEKMPDKQLKKSTDESTKKNAEESTKESTKKSTDESTKKNAEKNTKKVAVNNEILDEITDKVMHKIGSIREIRIDNILQSKHAWNGIKWEIVCRKKGCVTPTCSPSGFCDKHQKEQAQNNIVGEIIKRGTERYKWGGKPPRWKLVCLVETCNKVAIQTKGNRCMEHYKMHEEGITVHTNVINIFNNVKDNFQITQQKIQRTKSNMTSEKDTDQNIEKSIPKEFNRSLAAAYKKSKKEPKEQMLSKEQKESSIIPVD